MIQTGGKGFNGLSRAEQEILVLAARIDLSPEERARFRQRLAGDLNWERILWAAERLAVSGLLFKHLDTDPDRDLVPPAVRQRLGEKYRKQAIRNARMYEQLGQVLDAAGRRDVALLLLKGSYLSRWLYGNIALRPSGDIDVLCREADIPALIDVLQGIGFEKTRIPARGRIEIQEIMKISKHLPPFVKRGWLNLEVHTNLAEFYLDHDVSADEIWQRAVPLDWKNRNVWALDPEDQLLHLSAHLIGHQERRVPILTWYCDIHEFVRRLRPAFNWEAVLRRANKLGLEEELYNLWGRLSGLWETPFPKEKVARLNKNSHMTSDFSGLFSNMTSIQADIHAARKYARFIKVAGRIPWRKGRFLYLWSLVFPDAEFIRRRYDLTSGQSVAFYRIYDIFLACRRASRGLFGKLRQRLSSRT